MTNWIQATEFAFVCCQRVVCPHPAVGVGASRKSSRGYWVDGSTFLFHFIRNQTAVPMNTIKGCKHIQTSSWRASLLVTSGQSHLTSLQSPIHKYEAYLTPGAACLHTTNTKNPQSQPPTITCMSLGTSVFLLASQPFCLCSITSFSMKHRRLSS